MVEIKAMKFCMDESKDSAGNDAVEVKVSSLIEEWKESPRDGAGVLEANGIYSTMKSLPAFNSNGMNLVVDLPIEETQQGDENGTTTPPVERTTNEPSWGSVKEPPLVAPSPRFVKRPRPSPENEVVDVTV